MMPVPLLFLGTKRRDDIRPTDRVDRICGGGFAAFAAFYGLGDVEAGSTLLRDLRRVRDPVRKGQVEDALAFLALAE